MEFVRRHSFEARLAEARKDSSKMLPMPRWKNTDPSSKFVTKDDLSCIIKEISKGQKVGDVAGESLDFADFHYPATLVGPPTSGTYPRRRAPSPQPNKRSRPSASTPPFSWSDRRQKRKSQPKRSGPSAPAKKRRTQETKSKGVQNGRGKTRGEERKVARVGTAQTRPGQKQTPRRK